MPPSGVSATRNRARAEAVIDWGFDPADDVLAPVERGPRALRQVDPLGHPEPLEEDHPLDRERPPGHDRAPTPIAAAGGVPGRRTVQITGRGSERYSNAPSARDRVDRAGASRRPAPRRHERPGFRPDRAALWAVMLGALLILVAATSAHAAAAAPMLVLGSMPRAR